MDASVVHANYKGIYYENPEADRHYIDPSTGAHFYYPDMVRTLLLLQQRISERTRNENPNGKKTCIINRRQADNLLKLKDQSKDPRSKSFDRMVHGVRRNKLIQRQEDQYVTYDSTNPILPKIKQSRFESNSSLIDKPQNNVLRLKKRPRNVLASGTVIKSLEQQQRKYMDSIHESFIENVEDTKSKICTVNRNNILRNIHAVRTKSRNMENGHSNIGAIRLSKLTTESSSKGTKDQTNTGVVRKARIGLSEFMYKHMLDRSSFVNKNGNK